MSDTKTKQLDPPDSSGSNAMCLNCYQCGTRRRCSVCGRCAFCTMECEEAAAANKGARSVCSYHLCHKIILPFKHRTLDIDSNEQEALLAVPVLNSPCGDKVENALPRGLRMVLVLNTVKNDGGRFMDDSRIGTGFEGMVKTYFFWKILDPTTL